MKGFDKVCLRCLMMNLCLQALHGAGLPPHHQTSLLAVFYRFQYILPIEVRGGTGRQTETGCRAASDLPAETPHLRLTKGPWKSDASCAPKELSGTESTWSISQSTTTSHKPSRDRVFSLARIPRPGTRETRMGKCHDVLPTSPPDVASFSYTPW